MMLSWAILICGLKKPLLGFFSSNVFLYVWLQVVCLKLHSKLTKTLLRSSAFLLTKYHCIQYYMSELKSNSSFIRFRFEGQGVARKGWSFLIKAALPKWSKTKKMRRKRKTEAQNLPRTRLTRRHSWHRRFHRFNPEWRQPARLLDKTAPRRKSPQTQPQIPQPPETYSVQRTTLQTRKHGSCPSEKAVAAGAVGPCGPATSIAEDTRTTWPRSSWGLYWFFCFAISPGSCLVCMKCSLFKRAWLVRTLANIRSHSGPS